jgi:murein DD-endopeptidase MepM/ murein hydrolase activator NlpD
VSEQVANDAIAKLAELVKPSKNGNKIVSAEIVGEVEVLGQLEETSEISALGDAADKLAAAAEDGLFKLKTTETYTETTAVDFKTETKEDSTMLKGKSTVLQAGVKGESETTYQLVFENGKQVSKKVLSEKVTKEAVNKIVVKGTKVETSTTTPDPSLPSCGKLNFAWPMDGWISSKFGMRDGTMHYGLDIAAVTGTPIYAEEAGTVTYSAEMGTYGLLVIIDHGNGFTTRYAHCSKLLVSVGDTVKETTKIALCGNTGNSRGAHLHFEIRYNGTAYDPLKYLP